MSAATQTTGTGGLDVLGAGLSYASRGWLAFPVHSIRNGRCTCGHADCKDPGKHPRTAHGLNDATTDETVIAAWWAKWTDANIAVRTGAQTGIVVLDVDPRHAGDDSLADLEREHGPLPDTVESLSGGGGRHLLFAHPGGDVLVRNKVGIAPGLDVRGDGGYIIAPPSLHVSGRRYAWRIGSGPDKVPLAPMPPWLLALVRDPAGQRQRAGGPGARIPEGERNATLTSLGGTMRRRA